MGPGSVPANGKRCPQSLHSELPLGLLGVEGSPHLWRGLGACTLQMLS